MAAGCRGSGDRPVLVGVIEALRRFGRVRPAAGGVDVVDVGAGLGGPAAWLQATTGRRVLALEPSGASAAAARQLFPGLPVVHAVAEELPLRGAAAGAVTMLGLLSVLDDVGAALVEARRVVRDGGILAITDYVAPDDARRLRAALPGGTTAQLPADLLRQLAAAGWDVVHVELGAPRSDDLWQKVRSRVEARVRRYVFERPHGRPAACPVAYRRERVARRRFSAAIEAGHVHRATVIARAA
jgi:SAM-dependent methyltransferase